VHVGQPLFLARQKQKEKISVSKRGPAAACHMSSDPSTKNVLRNRRKQAAKDEAKDAAKAAAGQLREAEARSGDSDVDPSGKSKGNRAQGMGWRVYLFEIIRMVIILGLFHVLYQAWDK
jgi:hypothetical protein